MSIALFLGALLSHDNVTWSSRISMEHFGWREGRETILSYLPMSHAAAHLIDAYMLMYRAGTVYIADSNALRGTLVKIQYRHKPT
jgi:long-chain-fatty-acid--CoA ligase ACSBG